MHLKHGLEESPAPWTFWAFVFTAFLVGLVLVTAIIGEMNRGKRELTQRRRRK
jgi:heme/copper-type cytochrome/quinol oxidase subunit 4